MASSRTISILIIAGQLTGYLCFSAAAQSIAPVGTSQTLDIGTWNIEWFGHASNGPTDDYKQRQNVKFIIGSAGIDIWSVQEIANETEFQTLLETLGPPWNGTLATEGYGDLLVGFIYNVETISPLSIGHILTDSAYEFAGRLPLQFTASVTLPDTTVMVTLISLHMKAGSDPASRDRRESASILLKAHLDAPTFAESHVVVLGDFNDELTSSISPGQNSPYANFVDDTDRYVFLTLPLEQNTIGTYCFNDPLCQTESTIDHILITRSLFRHYDPESTARLESVLSAFPDYVFSTSDHMPVYARLRFAEATGLASSVPVPLMISIQALFPNPVRDRLSLSVESKDPDRLQVQVFDLLGRMKRTLVIGPGAGPQTFDVDTRDLPSGVYILRVVSGSSVRYARFVRMANY